MEDEAPERTERGVITMEDESPLFFQDDCEEEEEETNVNSDSVDGPNSGLMDVEALRILVRMEMLLLLAIVVLLLGWLLLAMLAWGCCLCTSPRYLCYLCTLVSSLQSE